MNTVLFIDSDLNKQAQTQPQVLENKILIKDNKITLTNQFPQYIKNLSDNILRIYLHEKLNFYHHILVRNAQM